MGVDKKSISRALIVKKEYLDLILEHGKVWEMRTSKTKLRGRVGLIEAGSGLIVGEITIVDSLDKMTWLNLALNYHRHKVHTSLLLEKWEYPWVLEDPHRYEVPKPYTHPPGAVIWVRL